MPSPLIMDPALVLNSLNQQRESRNFCDVILKCGSHTTFAHASVLAAASQVFGGVLSQVMESWTEEERSRLVQLEVDELFADELGPHFLDIIDFLYSANPPGTLSSDLIQLVVAKLELNHVRNVNTNPNPSPSTNLTTPVIKTEMSQLKTDLPPDERMDPAKKGTKDDIKMDVSFCLKCDLLFISQEEFLTHRMLNCTRKFTCKTCGTMFSRVQSLLEHLVEVRHGETACSVCSYVCLSSNEMEGHIEKHLSQREKPYFCLQCDSRFASRYALSQHVPKHSVETPFVCQLCTKGFKWKHALTSHMITHSNDKKFLCQDCGYATAHSSVFKSHQRIHSGQTLKCGLPGCKFETIRKQNLSQHQMTHSKEKPHQCEVCGMSFSMVKNLRRHMRKHDFLAKKYKCQVEKCQFSSLRADKFMEHMKKNHSTGTELTGDPTKSVFDAINPPTRQCQT